MLSSATPMKAMERGVTPPCPAAAQREGWVRVRRMGERRARPAESQRPLLRRLRLWPILCCRGVRAAVLPEAGLPEPPPLERNGTTDAEAGLFWDQGYLWIRGFASSAEVARLRSAMADMLAAWKLPDGEPARERVHADAAVSSLRVPTACAPDCREPDHAFMIASATKASFFLEPEAVDLAAGGPRPGIPKGRAIRKVAHGIHLAEGPFRDFVRSPKLAHLVARLGWRRPRVAQTLYRLAPPLAPGVDRHQDSSFLYTEPPSCLGVWLALEDADETNGCLRVRRGSHREPIRERLVRRNGTPGAGEGAVRLAFERTAGASAAPDAAFAPLVAAPGDLVVMHGALEHFSAAGVDRHRTRESLQVHIVDADAKWHPDNWLQYPPGMGFLPLVDPPAATPQLRTDL
mmetsp:Transcript_48488/g.152368  ORF Transcript_48488/g.152368 Transcript_48488/m.152368 type:complete len:404 (+) Transcript_48488:35-1246(+)